MKTLKNILIFTIVFSFAMFVVNSAIAQLDEPSQKEWGTGKDYSDKSKRNDYSDKMKTVDLKAIKQGEEKVKLTWDEAITANQYKIFRAVTKQEVAAKLPSEKHKTGETPKIGETPAEEPEAKTGEKTGEKGSEMVELDVLLQDRIMASNLNFEEIATTQKNEFTDEDVIDAAEPVIEKSEGAPGMEGMEGKKETEPVEQPTTGLDEDVNFVYYVATVDQDGNVKERSNYAIVRFNETTLSRR